MIKSYSPDRWTIIDYSPQYPDDKRYAVKDGGDCWNVSTLSGSLYALRKSAYGVTGTTAQLISQASLDVLTEEAVVELFTKFAKESKND